MAFNSAKLVRRFKRADKIETRPPLAYIQVPLGNPMTPIYEAWCELGEKILGYDETARPPGGAGLAGAHDDPVAADRKNPAQGAETARQHAARRIQGARRVHPPGGGAESARGAGKPPLVAALALHNVAVRFPP